MGVWITRIWSALSAAALLASHPRTLTAQQAPGTARPPSTSERQTGSIRGTITDSSGAALAGVEVTSGARRTSTSAAGSYRLDSIPAGPHRVHVRRIGFVPLTRIIDVRPGAPATLDVVLSIAVPDLTPVVVQGVRDTAGGLPPGFTDRARTGMGTYLTASDIARQRPQSMSDLLRGVHGVQITRTGGVTNTRGVTSVLLSGCRYGMAVFLDGMVMDDPHYGADTLRVSSLVDAVDPSDVVGIEVYRGPSEMPATLPHVPCGAVFIWTKTQ